MLGELAQLGERLVCNQEVTGSIPVFSTRTPGNPLPHEEPPRVPHAGTEFQPSRLCGGLA